MLGSTSFPSRCWQRLAAHPTTLHSTHDSRSLNPCHFETCWARRWCLRSPVACSNMLWMYHSHILESADTYSGLMGPMLITRAGAGGWGHGRECVPALRRPSASPGAAALNARVTPCHQPALALAQLQPSASSQAPCFLPFFHADPGRALQPPPTRQQPCPPCPWMWTRRWSCSSRCWRSGLRAMSWTIS